MELFDKFKKNRSEGRGDGTSGQGAAASAAGEQLGNLELSEDDLKRLSAGASMIIDSLKAAFAEPDGRLDVWKPLFYASGMAGLACHKAVERINPALFVVVGMNDGTKYYFGDAVNKFLLEDKYSVRGFCDGIYSIMEPAMPVPDCMGVVQSIAASIGSPQYKIWNAYEPKYVYGQSCACWENFFHRVIEGCCKGPREWPVLLAIVLQNTMKPAMEVAPKEQVYLMAMECACYISKMGDESV